MMRLRRVIWPLLAAFGLLVMGGMGVGTAVGQEPEPEWYTINLPMDYMGMVNVTPMTSSGCVPDFENGGYACSGLAQAGNRLGVGQFRVPSPNSMDMAFGLQEGRVQAIIIHVYSQDVHRYENQSGTYTTSLFVQTSRNLSGANLEKVECGYWGATAPQYCVDQGMALHRWGLIGGNSFPNNTQPHNDLLWGIQTSSSGNKSWWIRSASYLVYGVPPTPPPPPPPPTPPFGFGSSCALVIDNGAILTATTSITAAQTITTGQLITVSANLVANGGFEESTNNLTPSGWQFTNGLHVPNLWSGLNPLAGSRHLLSDLMPEIVASQTMSLPTAPNYQISAAVQAEHGAANQMLVVRLGLDTLTVPFSDEPYKVYSTTVQTGGERPLRVEIPDTTGLASPVSVDNVAVIPVEGDALNGYSVFCPAVGEHYLNSNNIQPPPPGSGGPGTLIGYQLPTFITAGQCLVCPTPTFAATSIGGAVQSVANWFSWLYCGLRTLVTCYIYVWLYNITVYIGWFVSVFVSSFNWGAYLTNTVIGWAFGGIGSFVALIFGYFLGFRNIYGFALEMLLDALGTSSMEIISNGLTAVGATGLANTFNALLNLGGSMDWMNFFFILTEAAWSVAWATVMGLSNVMIAIITLVFRIINALREAVTADAMTIQMWAEEGELGSDFMVAFFWTLSTVDDTLFVLRLIPIIYMGVAGFGLMLMYWLVNKWSISIF